MFPDQEVPARAIPVWESVMKNCYIHETIAPPKFKYRKTRIIYSFSYNHIRHWYVTPKTKSGYTHFRYNGLCLDFLPNLDVIVKQRNKVATVVCFHINPEHPVLVPKTLSYVIGYYRIRAYRSIAFEVDTHNYMEREVNAYFKQLSEEENSNFVFEKRFHGLNCYVFKYNNIYYKEDEVLSDCTS
jgi:hypothetical protein